MNNKDLATPTAQPALVCDEARAGLHPSGFDQAQLEALSGDRYSPNLRKWLVRNRRFLGTPHVFRDRDNVRWIGWIDDGAEFIGCRLMRCLTVGAKAEVWCWTFPVAELTEEPEFWARYVHIGRCAIDTHHNGWWQTEGTRWRQNGDTRSCLWCGAHTQHLRRWTETVDRERWEPQS